MSASPNTDLQKRREATVKAHIQAESVLHDVNAVIATFSHPRYEVPALATTADGAEAVRGLLTALLDAFPDFSLKTTAVHHAEDAVILECTLGGTHKGTWAGVAPTGRHMEVQSALIFQFEDANLVCEKAFFDQATILRQLGAAA